MFDTILQSVASSSGQLPSRGKLLLSSAGLRRGSRQSDTAGVLDSSDALVPYVCRESFRSMKHRQLPALIEHLVMLP